MVHLTGHLEAPDVTDWEYDEKLTNYKVQVTAKNMPPTKAY